MPADQHRSSETTRDRGVSEEPARRSLWQNRDFLKLWGGQSISLLGSQITALALPLMAAATIQASPLQMAFLLLTWYAPASLVGLLAGAWVDRVRRRPVLVGADLERALLLLAVPAAALLGVLRMELLYAVSFLTTVLGVFFDVAYGAHLPAVVDREHLVEGNSRLTTSSTIARIAGAGVAGGLIQLLGAPFAVVIDALSFVVSAVTLAVIRAPDLRPTQPEGRRDRHILAEVADGLRVLAAEPHLRAFVLSSATLDVFWNALMVVYFLYVTRVVRLEAGAVGLILGIGSVGALLSSLVASRLTRRVGLGAALVGAQIVIGLGGLLIALSVWMLWAALPLLIAAEVVRSFANTVYGINRGSITQAVTPDYLRGRVGGSMSFAGFGAATAGALLGGALGEAAGISATVVIGACGGTIAFVWLLLSPQPMPVRTDLADYTRVGD